MMLLSTVVFQFQFCSSPTLNSIWPPEPGYENSMDMTCNFFSISYKKKGNDNFCPTLKSIQLLGPGHTSSIDMICKNNVNNNFSSTLSFQGQVYVKTTLMIILFSL